jgi:cardiolipin synthase A/B
MVWHMHIVWWLFWPFVAYFIAVMVTLVMENREPGDTLAWGFALLAFPFVGVIFYLLFGRDWATITAKRPWIAAALQAEKDALTPLFERNASAVRRFDQRYGGTYVDRLRKAIRRESGYRLLTADSAEIFPTGGEKFGRLKADLAKAKRFIHIQYFIWEDDELTDALIEILRERLTAGVKVRFLYDYVGSIAWSKKKLDALVPLGAQVGGDMTDLAKLNYRDHRKIAVIDAEIGYTGGFNVGQEYIDGGKRYDRWRDTHLRLTGQIVGELEALFARRWYEKTRENVLTPEYLPAPSSDGEESGVLCQVVAQNVEEPWQSSRRAHMIAIGNAERRVWIQSPYFVPEVGLYDTLMNAALSGVDVRFMMTGVPDKKMPYWAAWTYFAPLLTAGARIYLYKAGFLHAKTIAVDSKICAIGTMNMDTRSLRLHKELMVWLYDEELTHEQERLFEEDMVNCREVTLAELQSLTFAERFRNSFMRLFSYFI